jgi:hypothetical protein
MKSSRYGSFRIHPWGSSSALSSSAVNTLVVIPESRPHRIIQRSFLRNAGMSGFDFRQAQRLTGEERQRNLYATKANV